MSSGKVLIVDDHKRVRVSLEILLQDEFEKVESLSNPKNLLTSLEENQFDLVLLDMNFSAGINTGNEGLYWLERIVQFQPNIAVILLTAYGDVELAVEAIKRGASDFVLKPWNNAKLIQTLRKALELKKSKQKVEELDEDKLQLTQELNVAKVPFIGSSKVMLELKGLIAKLAATDANVLITGEHGTGKELIAREIHQQSERENYPLLAVDMGALNENLFESEMFGYVEGAFTDARNMKKGRFELASGGTLFLDEIGNLSLAMQAKLLSVLQIRKVARLGDHQLRTIDIRLICATNKDLRKMVQEGTFREDLLYRINTICLESPSLRSRDNDVSLLAEYYLKKYAHKYGRKEMCLSGEAVEQLKKYDWPGNVRELQHTMEKTVILSDHCLLKAEDFNLEKHKSDSELHPMSFEEMEQKMISSSMNRHKGNLSKVAQELGVTRPTLYHKIKKYDL